MIPSFKVTETMMAVLLLGVVLLSLTSCTQSLAVLDGATHACGNVHIEGYFTDTQGDVVIAKAPDDWNPAQVKEFCGNQ